MDAQQPPVVCVSYLAAARLYRIREHPPTNHGAEVTGVEDAIAADGPIVAATLAALGMPVRLCCNDIGTDAAGALLTRTAARAGIDLRPKRRRDLRTPEIVVLTDDVGNRAWFAYLPQVTESIRAALDPSHIESASLVYVDCYEIIEAAALEAIRAVAHERIPLYANLGGAPTSPRIQAALNAHPLVACIQTNVDENRHEDAARLAKHLAATTGANTAVVTAGAHGAVAATEGHIHWTPAHPVTVHHAHGAGAAFSGGYIYGLLHDWNIQDTLDFACASGGLRCATPHSSPWPTLDHIRAFASRRNIA